MHKISTKLLLGIFGLVTTYAFAAENPQLTIVVEDTPGFHFYSGKKNALGYLPRPNQIIFASNGTKKLPMRRFNEWTTSSRDRLLLFKGYQEPTIIVPATETTEETSKLKELEIFEAKFAFILDKPFESVSREKIMSPDLHLLSQIDPTIVFSQISPSDVEPTGDVATDSQPWCKNADQICIKAEIDLSDFVESTLSSAYAIEGRANPPQSILYQAELNWLEGKDAESYMLAKSALKVLNQKIFYIDHYLQFGVTNIIFHKTKDDKILVIGAVAIAIQKDFLDMGKDKIEKFYSKIGYQGKKLSARDLITQGSEIPGFTGLESGLIPYTKEKAKALYNYLNQNL